MSDWIGAQEDGPGEGSLSSLTRAGLEELMQAMGQPAFRAGQLFDWLHAKRVDSLDRMTNLPAALRVQLAQRWRVDAPVVAEKQVAADGTEKMLLRLHDGACVETVLMRYHYGPSVCVSSQVGCRMGCRFCASTVAGLQRNLTAGEMAGQVYAAARQAGERISHVVLMGIGEPLENLDNVVDFITILTDPAGYGLSGRAVSLSTCGVVPGIDALAQHKLPLTLSVSLHAALNDKRSGLMPVNRRWPVDELMAACGRYYAATGRRISYEYALLRDVNDSDADADALRGLLAGQNAHVNLIRANEVEGSPFRPSSQQRTDAFAARLAAGGIKTTVRRRLGTDIDAACGQLRVKRGLPGADGA